MGGSLNQSNSLYSSLFVKRLKKIFFVEDIPLFRLSDENIKICLQINHCKIKSAGIQDSPFVAA